MASTVDLVVRVLADTSQAGRAFEGFTGNIGKALGVGASGVVAGTVVAASTEAAIKQQAAMARIQASYNSVDFQPGTDAYTASVQEIIQQSQTLATSMEDVAGVHNQAARFVDDFGNRLPKDEVTAYTDSVLKLAKVSLDDIAPTDLEAKIATFEKLSNQTNFSPVANAIAASSSIHSQGEGQMLDSAIAILQSGGALGVSQAQAGGIANYLTDLGQGGQRGGASIGRLLLRQDASADELLDPAVSAGKAKKARESQEHLDDLQTSLREAEASQAQMYGAHGLKTQFRKNPEAVMQSEDRIAKLNREIADAKADQITDAAVAAKTAKGQLNVTAMAQTAGMDPQAYAELAKSNPVEALLDFTRGLHALPASDVGAAERAAGISNVKDIQTIDLLQSRPDVLQQQIDTFQQQLDHPTALDQMSKPILDATESKQADVAAMKQNVLAAAGEGPRQELDALLDEIMKLGKAAQDSSGPVGQVVAGLDGLGSVVGVVAPFLLPFIGTKLAMGGKGASSTADIATGAAAESGPASMLSQVGGLLAGGLGGLAAGGVAYLQLNQMAQSLDQLNQYRQSQGLAPVTVNIGDIVHQGGSPDEILDHVITQVRAAWATAMSSTPVSGAVGGNIGAASPAH